MIHKSLQPTRSVGDGTSSQVEVRKGGPRNDLQIQRYHELEGALDKVGVYKYVFINDFIPIHRKKRYDYISEMKLPYDVEVYGYHPGARNHSLWFCWKTEGINPARTNACIHEIEGSGQLPQYHTRAMRYEFISRFSLVAKLSPPVMTELYQFLTGDQSQASSQISKDVQSRLRLLLDSQDPDMVFDLRHFNEGRPECFKEFWCEVDKYLNEEAAKAVDDRCHGTVCHSGVAMSIPDLRNVITSRLSSETPIPSEKWLFLQFAPQNPYHKSAIHYSGQFNLKLKVQSRQYSIDHPDAHYAAAVFRYLKEFCVKFKDNVVLMCVDDKAAIPIGEPGVPMASVARGKKTVVQSGIPFLVADHDTATKCKVIPSTILIPDIPDSVDEGSFYRGTVCNILKDSIFQPSSPLGHSVEIRKMLGITGNLSKPIKLIYSDGGPDHRVTYPSVQLALVALFLLDDADVLIAARCCPSRSFTNPAERWHSVMNLALQSVALERSPMEPQFEKVIQRCDTMKAIRDAGLKINGFSNAVTQSLNTVIQTLSDLLSRLSLKGRPCIISEPAPDQLLDELWDVLTTLDSSLSKVDTTSKSLSGKKNLQTFLEHCTVRRQYFFMIKKCGKQGCLICKPVRLPSEVFDEIHFLPDPVPSPVDANHFQPFGDLYGQKTSEDHRPSLQQKKVSVGSVAKEQGVRICGETVRAVLKCEECNKPRCVYSNKKLSEYQIQALHAIQEEICFILDGISCATEVSNHYFSSKSRLKFVDVCFVCGENENLKTIPVEEKSKFQSIHLVQSFYDKNRTNLKLIAKEFILSPTKFQM